MPGGRRNGECPGALEIGVADSKVDEGSGNGSGAGGRMSDENGQDQGKGRL